MLMHIAMFRWHPGTDPKRVQDALDLVRQLRDKVPGIVDIRCGANTHTESKGMTHAIVVYARNAAALDAYRRHPDHEQVASIISAMEEDGLGCDFEDPRSEDAAEV